MMADKSESFMKQAHHLWSMLDEMAANNPEGYRKFIDKNLKEGKEAMQPPKPNMCIQTTVTDKNATSMLFINFMAWPKVLPPKSDDDPIPICGGKIYDEKDDEGNEEKVISVAFHPSVLEDYGYDSNKREERHLLINLAIDFIQDQHKLKISRNYTKLDIRCKGSSMKGIQSLVRNLNGSSSQKFEDELTELEQTFGPLAAGCKDSLLNQMSGIGQTSDHMDESGMADVLRLPTDEQMNHRTSKKPLIEEVSSTETRLQTPEVDQQVIEGEEGHPRRLILRIKLDDVKSITECILDLSEDDLSLLVPDRYSLQMPLKEKILPDQSDARFSRRSSRLTLTLPCAPV